MAGRIRRRCRPPKCKRHASVSVATSARPPTVFTLIAIIAASSGCAVQVDKHYRIVPSPESPREFRLGGMVTDQLVNLWESQDKDAAVTLEVLREITETVPIVIDDSVVGIMSAQDLWTEAIQPRFQGTFRSALRSVSRDISHRGLCIRVTGDADTRRVVRWASCVREFVGEPIQHVDQIESAMDRIVVASDRPKLAFASTNETFVPYGFNYDHRGGASLEDYWMEDWDLVKSDFAEMSDLGANCVRIHLQFGKFMVSEKQPNVEALAQLRQLLSLAERHGLYLDITGLACYDPASIPTWYDRLSERRRWEAQSTFWAAIARTCAGSPAVFCYDLMNEPVFDSGANSDVSPWLVGEGLGGKYFVQRLVRDLNGRSREEVAKAWVDKLVTTIRQHDPETLVTVGVIPWGIAFYPGGGPIFYGNTAGENLDFVSIHVHPGSIEDDPNAITNAIAGLSKYDLGKPLIIEETSHYRCGPEAWEEFLDGSLPVADGWMCYFWGDTPAELEANGDLLSLYVKRMLEVWIAKGPTLLAAGQ